MSQKFQLFFQAIAGLEIGIDFLAALPIGL